MENPASPSNPPAPQPNALPPPNPSASQHLPPGYGPPPGYPPQQQGYPMNYPPGYGPPPGQPGYPPGYGAPPQGYAMPPQGYGYPPQGYAMPPQGYGYPPQPGMGYPPPPGMPMPAPVPMAQAMPQPPAPTFVAQATPAPVSRAAPTPAVAAPLPAPAHVSVPAPSAAVAPVVAAVQAASHETPAFPHVEGEVYHPPILTDIGPAPKRNKFVEAWRKIGGGSLALSIGIHVGLFFVAGLIIFTTTQLEKTIDFLPGGGTAQGEKASSDVQQKKQQKKRSTINKTTPMKKVVSTSTNAAISLPDAPPDILDVPDVSSAMGGSMGASGGFGKGGAGGGFGNGIGMGGAGGMVSLPPSMRSRCGTAERLQKLAQNGGKPECESAVSKSLEWLKTKQNKDGSWGGGNKAGYTGMALLCYLGRCETPDSPFYGENVMNGIIYLIELSKKNERGYMSERPEAISAAYEHGIATYALGEMYTLARLGSKSLPGMKDAFENGVKLIIEHQNEKGGWDYYTKNKLVDGKMNSGRDDLSVVGWQYQALKAAKHTGLKIPGLHESISRCTKYLESTQTKDGGFGVANRDEHYNQWSLTGTAVLGLQTLAKGKTTQVNKGMKFLHNFIEAEPLDWNKNCNLYCWYYYTQAFFQQGGDEWKFYNEQLLPNLLSNQAADGSWKPGRANWAAGDAKDPVYRQCLCTLQLEVYYRYLKVADRDNDSFFDK